MQGNKKYTLVNKDQYDKIIQLYILIITSCYQFKVDFLYIFQKQAIIYKKKTLKVTVY